MQNRFFRSAANIFYVHKRGVLLCMLICFVMQSLTTGIVLCFGDDGHVELEVGLKGECCQTFNKNFQECLTSIYSDQDFNSHCGICCDIPLYITAEKKHNAESIVLDQLVSLLQTSSYSAALVDQSTIRNTFHSITTAAFHVLTIQTVILQV